MVRNKTEGSKREFWVGLFVVGVMVLVGWFVMYKKQAGVQEAPSTQTQAIRNFQECVDAGNPVMESYPEQCAANGQTFVKETPQDQNNGWNTPLVSGKDGFETILPDGFGPVINVKNDNALFVAGTRQPELKIGSPVKIENVDGYGTDAPGLFSIVLLEEATDTPRGSAESHTLVNGKENPIDGKKYTYIYREDSLEGIGHQRFEGDRDYVYLFSLPGGKQLIVTYSVYGSDPRNNVETVEAIIDNIKLR